MAIIAYIRVSTEMQSLSAQEFEITKYCKANHIKVDRWVSESVSGTLPIEKRKLGKALFTMHKGDKLLCTEISRLGRNMLMIMSILNFCSGKGILIHSIKDNFDLSDNINSKIIAFAFALAAEIERNLISQRTKEALAVKRLEGVKLGRPPGSSSKLKVFIREESKIRDMLDNNVPIYIIARKYNIHRNTLRRYLNKD